LQEARGLATGKRPCKRQEALQEARGLARGKRPCKRQEALQQARGLATGKRPGLILVTFRNLVIFLKTFGASTASFLCLYCGK